MKWKVILTEIRNALLFVFAIFIPYLLWCFLETLNKILGG